MLHGTKALSKCTVQASDGETGPVHTFLFSDLDWKIRYVAVDMGGWFSDRKVLLAPNILEQPDWTNDVLPVALTKEQVENSPTLDVIQPYSHQMQSISVATLSMSATYPGGRFFPTVPMGVQPIEVANGQSKEDQEQSSQEQSSQEKVIKNIDPHLRSTYDVTGYNIEAKDGSVGHVEDFLIDDQSWFIQYIVVDTRNWFPGGDHVLIAPAWLETINWAKHNIRVNLHEETIRNSPKYSPNQSILSSIGERLSEYYERIGV